jgi:hypothetical protein
MSKCKRCTSCSAGILCQCNNKVKKTEIDNVNHPTHYLKDSGHEVIDVIEAWNLGFDLGNAIKYIARSGKKNPDKLKEDLNKAIWYIQHQLNKI